MHATNLGKGRLMKMYLRPMLAVAAMTSVSACMGGGGGDDIVTSNGILTLEVPDQGTYASLGSKEQLLVDNVIDSNTMQGAATMPPAGSSLYSGTFALVFDGDGAMITGNTTLTVTSDTNIAYDFEAIDIDDPDNPGATVSGNLLGSTTVSGGYFSGSVLGNVEYDTDGAGSEPFVDVDVSGTVTGAFDDDLDGFGSLEGGATGTGVDSEFYGLFHTTTD